MFVRLFFTGRHSDSLRARRCGVRTFVGARFSGSVQAGPWPAQPLLQCVSDIFLAVKQPGHGVDHPRPSSG